MPSKSAEPRSIAAQLVLLFTFAAALVLACALGVFYWIVVQHAFAEDNAVLADRIRAIRAELQEPNGLEAIKQELTSRRASEPTAHWVRILDSESNVVAETPDMDRLLPANVFPTPVELGSSIGRPQDHRADARLFSLAAITTADGGRQYTIQVAQDRSTDEQFRQKFRALLFVSIALGILASAIVAVTVTRRGLRPLREMTTSLGRITPTHLDERVSAAKWPHELQPLAAAFDQMLDRLENSFNRLSQFSADLAHELRTPIGNMLGEAQVALSRARTAEEYREIIESSVAECERLSGIVDNLLFLARADSADRQIQPTVLDAHSAVEKIASYYRTVAEDRNVAIDSEGEGKIFADPALFNRALNNLLENALRFTPDGGKIEISITPETTQTIVAVHDTGCGITTEHLPRVFDRFYRVDPARNSSGTGLGLALVKSIADLHGGSVDIKSQVGGGTTVSLAFPNKT
jgi:two-component system heavy metal sensor histidine kinase CusS